MNKDEAQTHIMDRSQSGAYELLKATVSDPSQYRILHGQLQIPDKGDKEEAWIPLAILKNSQLSVDYMGRAQSSGARCIYKNRVSDLGNAHQGNDGVWCWDSD